MYIEASYPRQPGDYARLNSPLLQFSGSMCLQFYYYMYGARMGTLTVNTNGSNVFNASGDKGNQWLGVAINVHLLGMYMVSGYQKVPCHLRLQKLCLLFYDTVYMYVYVVL